MAGFIFVGIGGGVGAMLRYAVSLIPCKQTFPYQTLIVNILGALLIGYITGIAAKRNVSHNIILLLKTGLCGGFTTFSTFSLEAYNMFTDGNFLSMGIYIALSVIGCILGVWCGICLAG